MKKSRTFLIFILSLCLLICSSACASKYPYEEVKSPFNYEQEYYDYYYKPNSHVYQFDRLVKISDLEIYYESSLRAGKVDRAIENLTRVGEALEIPQKIFLSEQAVTHANDTQLWVNVSDEAALIGGVLLAHAGQERLPFGCYAGASAQLLGERAEIEKAELSSEQKELADARELQYPLYLRSAEKKVGQAAWSLGQAVAKDYLATHTLEELKASEREDWEEIFVSYGARIPDEYHFCVGDSAFPTQILTKNFHYYFACDYKDRHYDEFDLSYGVLREFALENEAYVEEMTTLLYDEEFSDPVDAFFGNEFIDVTIAGLADISRNAIVCNAAEAFSHEATHFISYNRSGIGGHELEEALCNYLPLISRNASWRNLGLWDLYRGNLIRKDNLLGDYVFSEKQLAFYQMLSELYDYHFGSATKETFDPMKLELLAAAYDAERYMKLDDVYPYSPVRVSLIYYVHTVYGIKGLFLLLKQFDYAEFEGKPFAEVYDDWQAYLDQFQVEEIYDKWMK